KGVKVGAERFALLKHLKKCRLYCALFTRAEVWRNLVKVSVICTPKNLMLLTHSRWGCDLLFKEELSQVKEGMKQVNELAHQLAISDVHLSMENARALEHLNSRWKVLQGSIEERLKQLQDAHRDFGPGSQHFLSSKSPPLLFE
ncbi:hypothetical protein XENORESO_005777, partial [Xenotaenia resolanae]